MPLDVLGVVREVGERATRRPRFFTALDRLDARVLVLLVERLGDLRRRRAPSRASASPSATSAFVHAIFSARSACVEQLFLHSRSAHGCRPARRRAPRATSSSLTSSAPPSTIMIESFEPATTSSMSLYSSCWNVGLSTQLSCMRPTRTAAIGPCNGIFDAFERERGRDEREHVGVVLLIRRDDVDEDLDFVLEAFGEERADRAVDDAAAERSRGRCGRPSRLMKPPGILPAAYVFSWYSTGAGRTGAGSRCR